MLVQENFLPNGIFLLSAPFSLCISPLTIVYCQARGPTWLVTRSILRPSVWTLGAMLCFLRAGTIRDLKTFLPPITLRIVRERDLSEMTVVLLRARPFHRSFRFSPSNAGPWSCAALCAVCNLSVLSASASMSFGPYFDTVSLLCL